MTYRAVKRCLGTWAPPFCFYSAVSSTRRCARALRFAGLVHNVGRHVHWGPSHRGDTSVPALARSPQAAAPLPRRYVTRAHALSSYPAGRPFAGRGQAAPLLCAFITDTAKRRRVRSCKSVTRYPQPCFRDNTFGSGKCSNRDVHHCMPSWAQTFASRSFNSRTSASRRATLAFTAASSEMPRDGDSAAK
jgi:hypothetical protein